MAVNCSASIPLPIESWHAPSYGIAAARRRLIGGDQKLHEAPSTIEVSATRNEVNPLLRKPMEPATDERIIDARRPSRTIRAAPAAFHHPGIGAVERRQTKGLGERPPSAGRWAAGCINWPSHPLAKGSRHYSILGSARRAFVRHNRQWVERRRRKLARYGLTSRFGSKRTIAARYRVAQPPPMAESSAAAAVNQIKYLQMLGVRKNPNLEVTPTHTGTGTRCADTMWGTLEHVMWAFCGMIPDLRTRQPRDGQMKCGTQPANISMIHRRQSLHASRSQLFLGKFKRNQCSNHLRESN
jgi:hypothetical protein